MGQKPASQTVKNNQPVVKNSFMKFANCSSSPDKQKIVSFYNSACTLKGLRKKIAKGKLWWILIFTAFERTQQYTRKPTEESNPYDDQFTHFIPVEPGEDEDFPPHLQNTYQTTKESSIPKSKALDSQNPSKRLAQSQYIHSVHNKKSPPLSAREQQFISQQVALNPESAISQSSQPRQIAANNTVKNLIDKPLSSVAEDTYSLKDHSGTKSCSRMEASLVNHYNTYKSNVFTSQDRVFNNDRNLITKDVKHEQSQPQFLNKLGRNRRNALNKPKSAMPRRCTNDTGAQSRPTLKPQNTEFRIHTSDGARMKNKLRRSYDQHALTAKNRCRTAAYNSRVGTKNNVNIQNPEPSLDEILDYQLVKEGVSDNCCNRC